MQKQYPQLLNDDFKVAWDKVLKVVNEYRLNEVVLEFITGKKPRVANVAQDLNVQAAIDLWRQEGALELWEFLKTLVEPIEDETSKEEEDYTGEL